MRQTLLTVLMAVVACAGAQARVVSLDSCRNMALRNNKAIRMADESIRGAGYHRKAAFAAYLPGIDFTGGYMYNQRQIELLGADAKLPTMTFDPLTMSYKYNVLVGLDGKPVTDPKTGTPIPTEVAVIPKEAMSYDTHNVFAGAFTLTQPLYMGGQIRALNQITRYAEQMARTMRDAAVQEIIYNVDEAYWLVVSLREKRRLAESFVSLVDTLAYNVRQMYDEGVATQSDVLKVDVRRNEARIALTKVDNGLTLSRMNLAQICGLEADAGLEPEEGALERPADAAPATAVALEEVYASRPDLATLRHGIDVSRHKANLVMGAMLPKVALVGAYSFSNPNVNNGFEKKFGGGFSVGATLTVPLWHWGGRYNEYRAARSATKVQELLLAEAEDKVQLQVSQARFKYQEAYKTYDMTVSNLRSADANLRNAEYGFREGVITTNDVIAAQTAWLQAHSEKIDAEIGVRLCDTYLAKVLGRLDY